MERGNIPHSGKKPLRAGAQLAFIAFVLGFFFLAQGGMLRPLDAYAVFALSSLLVALLLAAVFPLNAQGGYRLPTVLKLCPLLILVAFLTNRFLDFSAPETKVLTITKISLGYTRRGGTGYHIHVPTPTQPLLLTLEYDNVLRLNTNSASYHAIIPGMTKAIIDIHKGLFRVPWYDHMRLER